MRLFLFYIFLFFSPSPLHLLHPHPPNFLSPFSPLFSPLSLFHPPIPPAYLGDIQYYKLSFSLKLRGFFSFFDVWEIFSPVFLRGGELGGGGLGLIFSGKMGFGYLGEGEGRGNISLFSFFLSWGKRGFFRGFRKASTRIHSQSFPPSRPLLTPPRT